MAAYHATRQLKDARRDRGLRAAGYRILRVTSEQVVHSELGDGQIAADAVTADLRTKDDNTLSFWRGESSSRHNPERAILAVAAAAERPDRLDKIS